MSDPNPFGKRTWKDVQRTVRARLRGRFQSATRDELDDAMGEVMLDLIGYWQSLGGSLSDDPERNYRFALRRGTWRGVDEITRVYSRNQHETRMDFADQQGDYDGPGSEWHAFVDPDPTPDELVEELDLSERARLMLEQLPEDQLGDYLEHVLKPESDYEMAKRLNLTRSSIQGRRNRRTRQLKQCAAKYGLR